MHLRVYCDEAFCENLDIHSQLRFVIFAAGDKDKAVITGYGSFKSRSVKGCSLRNEVFAFADTYDAAYSISELIKPIIQRSQP